MPNISAETKESIQTTEEVIQEYQQKVREGKLPSPVLNYWLFSKLQKSMNFDEHSRLSGFGRYVAHFRRQSIMSMFTGDNHDEIAKSLQIPIHTVKNDIVAYYQSRKPIRNSKKQ